MDKDRFTQAWMDILEEIQGALKNVDDTEVETLIGNIVNARKIFCLGAGRSKSIMQSFCIRLNHLGLEAYEVGGIPCPPITSDDLIIASTGSASTVSVLAVLRKVKEEGAKIAIFTANNSPEIRSLTDDVVLIKAPYELLNKGDSRSEQPMRSLFEQAVFIIQESIILILSSSIPLSEIVKRHTNLE